MNFQKGFWVIFFTLILLLVWGYNLPFILNKGTITEKTLYRLDSVRILSRAYTLGAAKSSTISGYEFQDATRHHFRLENPYFSGIISHSRLYDTLQYSGTVMTILTDEEGFNNFRSLTRDAINIHQIYIGEKPYIDDKKVARKRTKVAKDWIIICSIVYILGLARYIYKWRRA